LLDNPYADTTPHADTYAEAYASQIRCATTSSLYG
jgi:hypothetical protein